MIDVLVDRPANAELLAVVADEELHAPSLLDHEVARVLRVTLAAGCWSPAAIGVDVQVFTPR